MLTFVCLLIVCLTIVIEKESGSGGERDKYMQTVVAVLCIVVALCLCIIERVDPHAIVHHEAIAQAVHVLYKKLCEITCKQYPL